MTSQTVNQLLQLLVNGPILLRQSTRSKNRYFKVALGAAGAVVIYMALNDMLKAREEKEIQRQLARRKQQKNQWRILQDG
jgi:hypothetical protein